MKPTISPLFAASWLALASAPALAAGFSVDCETRATEKDHRGGTLSADTQSHIHIDARDDGMTVSGNGSQSRYATLRADPTAAAYYLNATMLKYKMRGPAGGMDIRVDRTSGDIYEIVDTKGRFVIVRGQCATAEGATKF